VAFFVYKDHIKPVAGSYNATPRSIIAEPEKFTKKESEGSSLYHTNKKAQAIAHALYTHHF